MAAIYEIWMMNLKYEFIKNISQTMPIYITKNLNIFWAVQHFTVDRKTDRHHSIKFRRGLETNKPSKSWLLKFTYLSP